MPKAPRDKENVTPKKRTTRKAAPVNGNGVHAESGNGVAVVPVAVSTEISAPSQLQPTNVEEQIRARAYEIYLERGGNGGSPEQDWLRALEEISGRQRTA